MNTDSSNSQGAECNTSVESSVKLFEPMQRLLYRTEQAGKLFLAHREKLNLQAIYVFGSIARGTCDYRSDVDMLLLVKGGPKESSRAKDYILANFYNELEGEHPVVDVHTCCTTDFYDKSGRLKDTTYGDFLECVRGESVKLWPK